MPLGPTPGFGTKIKDETPEPIKSDNYVIRPMLFEMELGGYKLAADVHDRNRINKVKSLSPGLSPNAIEKWACNDKYDKKQKALRDIHELAKWAQSQEYATKEDFREYFIENPRF